ncbi:sigma 54-interacting transcriptional regulator [Maridesulfovibrio frigidus]|uniref:sigma 54-interacting transcriptional regulator n=1 Tax=Maridesulfovibrio frigidus TaxID=340956 RepID=UPI00068B157A|nr:sigma 54-interacting transcriptional regulator [Maridesulfovibrio frigidus]
MNAPINIKEGLNNSRKEAENLKFKLLFEDRVGIVFDITRLMTEQGLNIIGMEVEQKDGFAKISIEIEKPKRNFDKKALFSLFSAIPKLESQGELKRLPQEKRNKWFRTLFDGMSEGIISVDSTGIINTANKVACRLLGLVHENIVGTHVSETSPKDNLLMECIEKRIPVSRRKSVITSTGRVEFYGSAKPINDSQGNFVGAVLQMNNLKEVKAMVDAVSTPLEITFDDFIGQSTAIKKLIDFAKKISVTGTTVSITGESGTGKELFAKAIHFESGRTGPFIPINCAALPEPLIESELFGYVDGAFTGARKKGKPGLFEVANNGTIFLDEIGDMPPGPQAKILRVLQEGLVRRIGGFEEIPVNTRVITATNKNLKEMVDEGRFREDLFYRINVLTVLIPPLRERLIDIPLLVGAFLEQFNRKLEKETQTINNAAIEKLYSYSWPGNVRELQNVIERASLLSDSSEIGTNAICPNAEPKGYCDRGCSVPNEINGKPLKKLIANYEISILIDALNSTASIRKAATKLGISHTALLKKIEKHELRSGNRKYRRNELEPLG